MTMIPTPPIHVVNCRHRAIDGDSAATSVTTVEPVVENPDIDSNRASTGCDSCGSASRYGTAPKTATSSQTTDTTR
jgi:hypothetical protein